MRQLAYIALRNFKDAFCCNEQKPRVNRSNSDNIDIKRAAYLRLASLYSAMGIKEEVGTYAKAKTITSADDVKIFVLQSCIYQFIN